MNKATVIGFSKVFVVTNKETGEVSRKINVSVSMPDPNYKAGEKVMELYLSVTDQFKYDWLEVGQEVVLGYSKFGKGWAVTGLDLA